MAEKDFNFNTEIKVRFKDCDMQGHVNNAVYFTYFEQARLQYFLNNGYLSKDWTKDDVGIIISEAYCKYISPAFFEEILLIYVRVVEIQKVRFKIEYEIYDKESRRFIAAGYSIQVMIDTNTNKILKIPQSYIDKAKEIEMRNF